MERRNSQGLSWQTSNMQYGDFYNSQDTQQGRRLRECEGRCEVLTKNLINCRAQLGHMRLRGACPLPTTTLHDDGLMDPPTSSYLVAHQQRLKLAKKVLSVKRSLKTYTQYEEAKPVHPHTKENQHIALDRTSPQDRSANWIDTSGIEEDTKQLEWLLNRLADKLQPLTGGELPILAKSDDIRISRSDCWDMWSSGSQHMDSEILGKEKIQYGVSKSFLLLCKFPLIARIGRSA
ncbi:hypothetical protein GOP47_0006967 [Adiantum capillus-veneris]|uniref:Uncharacterized protein n=1 Tax=Adiantum capillus-veneris TaxID=13818 RepID=A0A9D4V004_ADICA|nr:hypothetical protein GOP47_0006967 [Adiantum capillus-veneris]